MKFDVVIGNPPYEGKGHPLYLQILEVVNKVSDKVVWLCPAQWTKNYKDSKYLKHIKFDTCKNLISHQIIKNPFQDAVLANEVGIYEFGKSDKYEDYETIRLERFKNPILTKSIWHKFESYKDNLFNHNRKDDGFNYYVSAAAIRGHFHESKPCWDWTTLFGEKQHEDFSKPKLTQSFWNFKTENECKNFISSSETDIFMFSIFIGKLNINIDLDKFDIMPWFGDYTHEWTEPMIQRELGLTDEEVDYIHEEMKPFGWKAQPKKKTK